MSERRYNEKELAEILRKAATAQAEGTIQDPETAGFTQADIERLAAEVGIEPRHIAGAVEEINSNTGLVKGSSRARPVLERTVTGTLDDIAWEELVAELRLAFGSAGTTSDVGSSREWAGGSEFTSAHLTATPRNGKTRLRLTIHQEGPTVMAWILSFAAAVFGSIGVGISLGKSGAGAPIVLAAILGIVFTVGVVANLVLANINRKNLKKGDEVLGRIKNLFPQTEETQMLETRLENAPVTAHQPVSVESTTSES